MIDIHLTQRHLSTTLVAYFVGIAPVAFHIAPTLIRGDMADRAVSPVAVLNIPPDMAD